MKKIDANIVLRYMMNDHAELSTKSKEIIEQNIVEVPIEVLCEVVYVLTGHYRIEKKNVCTEIKRFFELTQCTLNNREVVFQGLEYFRKQNLDFVDCLLAAYSKIENDEIITFDENLKKLIKVSE